MILEDATFEAFGYYPSKLLPHSCKPILAACDDCGKVRKISKNVYHALCGSCGMNGEKNHNFDKHFTEEHKAKLSAAHKGKKHTEETKARMSAARKGKMHHNYGKHGDECSWYKGGRKIALAKDNAKRKQQLGYTLLLPLAEGEVGHHVTNEFVIGIPKDVHQRLSGGGRKRHRTKVLMWLKANDARKYNLVLCALAKEHLKN